MEKWEYYGIKCTGAISLANLNILGAKGWEMVSHMHHGPVEVIYFKRKIEVI